jgi:hypothetical protein
VSRPTSLSPVISDIRRHFDVLLSTDGKYLKIWAQATEPDANLSILEPYGESTGSVQSILDKTNFGGMARSKETYKLVLNKQVQRLADTVVSKLNDIGSRIEWTMSGDKKSQIKLAQYGTTESQQTTIQDADRGEANEALQSLLEEVAKETKEVRALMPARPTSTATACTCDFASQVQVLGPLGA